MVNKNFKLYLLISVIAVSVFFSINSVFATSCWSYTSLGTCNSDNSCNWRNDSWSTSGWCEEKSCWNFYEQSQCSSANIPGKNCSWQAGGTNNYCTDVSCWSFAGKNESFCVNNSAGLGCKYEGRCYNNGGSTTNCWGISAESTCRNTTGCAWGDCMTKSCYEHSTNTSCIAAKDYNGRNCTWDSSTSYCNQKYCSNYANETACNSATGVSCNWKWNSCQDVNCWTWDGTNQTACVNNTANFTCNWDGKWCMTHGCWNFNTQSTCQQRSNCVWSSWTTSGWCEEIDCYKWDSWKGGNSSICTTNSSLYGLNCVWSGNPSGNLTGGWCYKNISSSVSCSNFTTERDCINSIYCWWQYTNWLNSSLGGTCNEPGGWNLGFNTTIKNDWNPKCYIFDNNITNCGLVSGCDNSTTAGKCIVSSTHGNANEINFNGINCTMINSSSLCNSISALSSCCSWQGSSCVDNKLTTSCWDQMSTPPAESCEGANLAEDESTRKSNCDRISNDPWYMPCKWINNTKMCGFKGSDVFGNSSMSLVKIENRKTCEYAGGKWITESYCEGNISVPTGRCEYKFDEEDNCNKACFACELKDSNGNIVNATNARDACFDSTLGTCSFTADTTAPNGIGYCNSKEQFKKGIAGDCDNNCGDCTYKGNILNNDTTKKPSYYCANSKANSAGGGCKWISDNSSVGGYCIKKGDKTCEDSCDRCYSQTNCQNIGRTGVANQSGSCKWQGTSDDGNCVPNIGEDVEICWNGLDDDDDNVIDCADSGCYSDSFCGFVEGDCFIYTNNNTCINANCEWTVDKWGSWCGFKGSQCWKYDTNTTTCSAQSNCKWNNGTGSGWCERDWNIAEQCMGLNRTSCSNPCIWTNDTWCSGFGNGTDWCNNYGGWCDHSDFAPKDCWKYQTSSTQCNNRTGCSWKNDASGWFQPHCETNMSANCWQYTTEGTCTGICTWRSETWGSYTSSWCDNKMNTCWSKYTQSTCEAVSGGVCSWRNDTMYGGSSCQPACFNSTNSISADSCNTVQGCYWKGESGWCEETQMASCSNSTNSNNQANCQGTSGCRWKNPGWCDPKDGFSSASTSTGGGVSGSMGAECWKYDGNQTLCTNKTIINISCGWMPETNPRCEVNFGNSNCWQYNSSTIGSGCNSTNGCWWNPGSGGSGWCGNLMDQCWSNTTYQSWNNPGGWAANCSLNYLCQNNSWGGCEPRCFSFNSSSCNNETYNGKCKWTTGWCTSASMSSMFTGMETGAPVPLGSDACGTESISQASVDICGFGMKDMGDSYGFGTNVYEFSNASICNKEKISSNVMNMVGGIAGGAVGGMFGGITSNEKTGAGNDSIEYFVYLDTDGSTSGSCALNYDSSAIGYEFKFVYSSQWNSSKEKAVETFTSYKCDNNKWVATDIKISAWKKKMCSEIGGPMIAVEKNDLTRFSSLYDSTKDIRVAVATADKYHNLTSPSDSASAGWTTPGAVDFEINNAFDYEADTSKFEDILRKGFVENEDCYSGADDDYDGYVNCNDWDCQYSDKCTNLGVNAPGYVDTSAPLVSGVKIEEYYDSALIMYDTNKPSNGTLLFYRNDSTCLKLNASIYDAGILKNNTVRQHKLWHIGEIYNNINSLPYSLTNNTQYFYKLKVCDSGGKCAISKCSNFTTALSSSECGYCDFVTRIKYPANWNVSYDANLNEIYEHTQGYVCGPNAGMKTNYTIGRRVSIKLAKTDGSVYMEFINATLTKTGLNDKVRTISTSGSLIHDTGTGSVGMISETRDKIINNLHPEICRVKIPYSGACNSLHHCNDTGGNCVDRTSSSILLDSANCVWQLPFCEFSTWDEDGNPAATTTTSSSGGGGGGGGAITKKNATSNQTTASSSGSSPDSATKDTESGESGVTGEEGGDISYEKKGIFNFIIIGVIIFIVIAGIIFLKQKKKKVFGY